MRYENGIGYVGQSGVNAVLDVVFFPEEAGLTAIFAFYYPACVACCSDTAAIAFAERSPFFDGG